MIEIPLTFAFSAFLAGFLMFLAPCTLPLIPAYLAFISGVSKDELNNPSTAKRSHRQIIYNSLSYVLGFSLVFVLFGVAAGALGSEIGLWRSVLSKVGGGFIILFGIMMLGMVSIKPLTRDWRITLPSSIKPGHPLSAFVIGMIFALGWTPCVGPVLATVILLATDSATVVTGAALLAIFSLGLAVPFILTALLYARAEQTIIKYAKFSGGVRIVGGVFLILIGTLLLTNNFELMVIYGYQLFEILQLDGLYNHL